MRFYQVQKKALEQFKEGKSLFGKDGVFAPMLKNFIEKALQVEMEEHLSEEERHATEEEKRRSRVLRALSR